jgi:hypothetical protein
MKIIADGVVRCPTGEHLLIERLPRKSKPAPVIYIDMMSCKASMTSKQEYRRNHTTKSDIASSTITPNLSSSVSFSYFFYFLKRSLVNFKSSKVNYPLRLMKIV